MKKQLEKITATLEESTGATWSVYDCGDGNKEFSTYSPAGENVIITIYGETVAALAEYAKESWDLFDAEEHAAEILIAKRSGDENKKRFYASAPDSLCELLEDAEAIDSLYKALYDALTAAATSAEA